uniref:Uncharacterized protein n=1 Tax=Rhizochromulina marina TaxID=1034831 RepID=A0A7S2RE45_9STRA|mmetsp:Transcript_14960/g.44330  ORF Transcript_14960/g.44330 Transcript_14960/m.44330 type:complete len:119 (+) Transcript_14960:89-445(+)
MGEVKLPGVFRVHGEAVVRGASEDDVWIPAADSSEEEEEEEEAGSRAAMQELRMALCLNVANVNDGRAKALDPRRPAVTVIVNHAAMAKKTADASSRAPSSSSRRERDCGEPAHEPGS